jgi:hypothetical protein
MISDQFDAHRLTFFFRLFHILVLMLSVSVRPTLPTELERAIFELAAFFDPDSLPVLLLVAHRVKIWYCPSSRLAPVFKR